MCVITSVLPRKEILSCHVHVVSAPRRAALMQFRAQHVPSMGGHDLAMVCVRKCRKLVQLTLLRVRNVWMQHDEVLQS